MNGRYSLIGLIVLVLDIIAIVHILRSGKSATAKLLWILLVLFFPVFGMIIYFIFGEGRVKV